MIIRPSTSLWFAWGSTLLLTCVSGCQDTAPPRVVHSPANNVAADPEPPSSPISVDPAIDASDDDPPPLAPTLTPPPPAEETTGPASRPTDTLVAQIAATPATADTLDEQQLTALGIRTLKSKYLTLHTDLRSMTAVDELPDVFDLAVPQICTYFHIDAAQVEKFHVVCSLIKEKQRFSRAGLLPSDLPPFPNGFNRGTTTWVYEQPSDYYRRHLVIHEGVHALMESILGGTGPPWYREGMAELLATHRWQNGKLTLKYFPRDKRETPEWGRIKIIKDEIAANRGMPLVEIMRYDTRAHLRNEPYAWCWAATMFFDTLPDTRPPFRKLRDAVTERQFNRDFYDQLRAKWSHVQEQWQVFTLEIEYGYDLSASVIERKPVQELAGTVKTTVEASRGWQSSGVRVEAGRKYKIAASGRFQVGADPQPWRSEADGITLEYRAGKPLGMLLAAVSDESRPLVGVTPLSTPIGIGAEAEFVPMKAGTLFLRINDSPARLQDNAGQLQVEIRHAD